MRIDPREGRITTPWPAYWIAVAAIAAVLAVQPALAFDSTREPPPTPDPPKSTEVFRDDFYGTGLAPHWSIERPDLAAFAVTDGALRVESRASVGVLGEGLANRFRLDEPMPSGDWTVTAQLKFRFDTGAENFYLTLRDEEDRWFGAQIRSVPNKYTGHRLMLAAVEGREGGSVAVNDRSWPSSARSATRNGCGRDSRGN